MSDERIRRSLVRQYSTLRAKLDDAKIPLARTIFVSIDDAGSSSPVALNMLRDGAQLQQTQATLLDSKNIIGLHNKTAALARNNDPMGIVYVDDFVGSGQQFEQSRTAAAANFVGNYSEFLLASVVCDEAIARLGSLGVEVLSPLVHSKAERPLLAGNSSVSATLRDQLLEISRRSLGSDGLGFNNMATMVILQSNAPDSTPLLLTGDYSVRPPKPGLFPRLQELPARGV
jgi:hypothetical protein